MRRLWLLGACFTLVIAGVPALAYHAGLDKDLRAARLEQFLEAEAAVMHGAEQLFPAVMAGLDPMHPAQKLALTLIAIARPEIVPQVTLR